MGSLRKNTARAMLWASRVGVLCWMPDRLYLRIIYWLKFNRKLDLDHPQTFNEKLQWLKLYNRKPEYTQMVDKYEVREYIEHIIGGQYLIPLLHKWDTVDEIDFDALPDRYVLKCNHDSGGIVICKDNKTLNRESARKKLGRAMRHNGYRYGREWPYKNVKPCIIAEQYMEDAEGKGNLTDYKLHFFSGECKAIMVGQNRFGDDGLENDFYTPSWEHFDFSRGHSHNASVYAEKPTELDEMLRLGKRLAADMPFVRVDFYIINHQVYFGEITFFPASGFGAFYPDRWDYIFGDWIILPM